MAELYLYSVLFGKKPLSIRLGWISPSTGILYCGICMGAAIASKVGAECPACGARVSQLLDARDNIVWKDVWRNAVATVIEEGKRESV
jgi:hypothetical protein